MVGGRYSVAYLPPRLTHRTLYNLLGQTGGYRLQDTMLPAGNTRPAVSTTVLTCPRPNLFLVISIKPTGRRANFLDGCRSKQKGNKSLLLEAWHMQAGDGSIIYHHLCL